MLLILPAEGFVDSEERSRADVEFQRSLAEAHGPIVSVVSMDRMKGPSSEARRVHREATPSAGAWSS